MFLFPPVREPTRVNWTLPYPHPSLSPATAKPSLFHMLRGKPLYKFWFLGHSLPSNITHEVLQPNLLPSWHCISDVIMELVCAPACCQGNVAVQLVFQRLVRKRESRIWAQDSLSPEYPSLLPPLPRAISLQRLEGESEGVLCASSLVCSPLLILSWSQFCHQEQRGSLFFVTAHDPKRPGTVSLGYCVAWDHEILKKKIISFLWPPLNTKLYACSSLGPHSLSHALFTAWEVYGVPLFSQCLGGNSKPSQSRSP